VEEGARERGAQTIERFGGSLVGPFILGYPWWLSGAVLVVFAALLWHTLGGRVHPTQRLPLAVVLAPACVLVAVVVAMALSSALSGPYEPPLMQTTPERMAPTTTTPVPSTTGPATTGQTASPTPSSPIPSPSPTASPTPSPEP
jgi:hypothetical protein